MKANISYLFYDKFDLPLPFVCPRRVCPYFFQYPKFHVYDNTLCRFSCIRLEFSGSRTYWIKAMSPYRTQKVLPQKRYNPSEEWDYLEEDTLKHTRSASVCMTCQHFNYCCDRHCRTILTCHLHQRLIPHGDHLTSKCQCWMQRD